MDMHRNHSVRTLKQGRFAGRADGLGLIALAALATAVSISAPAAAESAEPGLRSFVLDPSGASFSAEVIGDEFFEYIRMQDGTVVMQDPRTGVYQVAALGQDATGAQALVPSGVLVRDLRAFGGNVDPSSLSLIDQSDLDALGEAAAARAPLLAPMSSGLTATSAIRRRLLTIMVEFTQPSGDAFNGKISTALSYWQQTLYGSQPGSVNHYYMDMSRGKFSFYAPRESQGTANDGIVRVKLPYAHPNSQSDYSTTQFYMREALKLANPYVNFAMYDFNADGKVSRDELDVIFLVAGYATNHTSKIPSIRGHALSFSQSITLDGKVIPGYAAFGEKHTFVKNGLATDIPSTVGTIVHELGHLAVGLPDLYKGPTDLCHFCLMSSGSWGNLKGEPAGSTPTAMSAWSRVHAHFLEPTVIQPGDPAHDIPIVQTAGSELFNQQVEPTIYKIETLDPDQYFLLDNRQNAGYDAGLSRFRDFDTQKGGIAVYRINEAKSAGQGKVHLVSEAPLLWSEQTDELYDQGPGNEFTPFSDPSSDDGDGMFTGLSLTDFSASNPIMVAHVGFVPFGCNEITARIAEHELHGRAQKQILESNGQQIFLGYVATGTGEALGLDESEVVTLHVEAPGLWSTGDCQ